MPPRTTNRVAVLGAGIQGSCVALALARRGINVDLYDQNLLPMRAASRYGEGKLHLGFVYANDPEQTTHKVMARGSISFWNIVNRLTGADLSACRRSSPFVYAVASDSMLDVAAISAHYQAVEVAIREVEAECGDLYFGERIDQVYRQLEQREVEALYAPDLVKAAFHTCERAINTGDFARALRRILADNDRIRFSGETEILSAEPTNDGQLRVTMDRDGQKSQTTYPVVVNCLWAGRLAIDASAGFAPTYSWVFRYKASLTMRGDTSAPLAPSTTLVLGPYGDFVNFGGGEYYLSWYPRFMLGRNSDLDGRNLQSLPESIDAISMVHEGISEMSAYLPSLQAIAATNPKFEVGGGVIFARGASDIVDPRSGLHRRAAIGVFQHGAYLTVDTGKYCTAPLFALEVADRVGEILGFGMQQ